MDNNGERNEIIRLCRKFGIRYQSNLEILDMHLDDFKEILAICIQKDINLTSIHIANIIFKRSAVEIQQIVNLCDANGIKISGLGITIFKKNIDEINGIINLCRENGLSYVTEDGFFRDVALNDLVSAVKACKENGIDIHSTEIMFRMNGPEIVEFLNICRDNNIPLDEAKGIDLWTLKSIVMTCNARGIPITSDILMQSAQILFKQSALEEIEELKTASQKVKETVYSAKENVYDNDRTVFSTVVDGAAKVLADKYRILKKTRDAAGYGIIDGDHLVISEGVETISPYAFQNYYNIRKITFPSTLKFISKGAFKNCTSLKSISLPEGVLEIDDEAFSGCCDLSSITFPSTLERIGAYSFQNAGIHKIEFPSGLRVIENNAFANCSKLATVQFNDGLEEVHSGAFYGCNISNCLEIPESVKVFDPSFRREKNLKYISYGRWGVHFNQVFGQEYTCGFESKEALFFKLVQMCRERNNIFFPLHYDGGSLNTLEHDEACMNIFRSVVTQSDTDRDAINAFKNYNHKFFTRNVRYMKYDFGMGDSEIVQMILDSGFSLLSGSIDDGIENFEYLVEQNIFSRDLLVKLYFDGVEGNTTMELLQNYYAKHKNMPPLFRTLMVEGNDKNRVELRDRLVFISTMKLVEGEELLQGNYSKVRMYLSRDLWESTVDHDESLMFRVDKDVYKVLDEKYPCLKGIIYPIYSKLCSIDKEMAAEFLESLKRKGTNTNFMKFYASLNIVQSWDEISDKVDRATLLKNEIFGRILYADMSLVLKDGSYSGYRDARRLYVSRKKSGVRNSFDEVVSEATKDNDKLFTNQDMICAMLAIDPYSFDALRSKNTLFVDGLGSDYVEFAIKQGYMFSEEEVKKLKTYPRFSNKSDASFGGTLKHYVEKIVNVVGIPKIPKEDKKEFLRAMRNKVQLYVRNKSSDSLFDFCRTVDFYLRENNEYMMYGPESIAASKYVFDNNSSISNDARVLYSLYSLNQLAHHAVEMNADATFKEHDRLSFDDDDKRKRKDAFNAYNTLYRYGMDFDAVNSLLSTSDRLEKLDFSPDGISYTKPILHFWRDAELCPNLYSDEDVMCIGDALQKINMLSREEIDLMEVGADEQNVFFECKRILATEVMKKVASTLSSKLIETMGSDLATKQDFYARNGFIAEVQMSDNGPVLVCLCEQFNEPFSIHLKDLPESVSQMFGSIIDNPPPPTIAHCSLDGKGLSLRGVDYNSKFDDTADTVAPGFYRSRDELSERLVAVQAANYKNYDVPASKIRVSDLIDSSQSKDDVPINGDDPLGNGGSGKK